MTSLLRRLAWLAALPLLGACADAPRDPVALLVAPEARAALEIGASLPSLPELTQRVSVDGVMSPELARAQALWTEATLTGDVTAAPVLRDAAYALAAPALAAGLDSAALAGVQARLERWVGLADMVLKQAEFPDLARALADARALLDRARSATARHDDTAAVTAILRAADRLSQTTPQAVARRLALEDESALTALRALEGKPATEEARVRLDRIERLVRDARQALSDGQYELAIRRAYYARQLLGVEGAAAGAAGR